jgi:peptidoglycan-associated lipoprotein
MKTQFLASALLVALLTGCASGVKLDDVPVEDRSAATSSGVSTQAIGINPSGAQTGVASVVVDKSGTGIGPAGVAHVVFFDYDSFVVRADARPVIENHARFLQANKQRKANLEGHTDERGGREYNLALGQKRAEAVRQALSLMGVAESQLEAVSYGKEKPSAQGSNEADLAKNRRVEIRY